MLYGLCSREANSLSHEYCNSPGPAREEQNHSMRRQYHTAEFEES